MTLPITSLKIVHSQYAFSHIFQALLTSLWPSSHDQVLQHTCLRWQSTGNGKIQMRTIPIVPKLCIQTNSFTVTKIQLCRASHGYSHTTFPCPRKMGTAWIYCSIPPLAIIIFISKEFLLVTFILSHFYIKCLFQTWGQLQYKCNGKMWKNKEC